MFKSNVMLINDSGKILKEILDDDSLNINSTEKEFFIENHLNMQLNNIIDIKMNIKLSKLYIKNIDHSELDLYKAIIVPIYIFSKRKASIMIYKKIENFCSDDLVLLEVLSVFITLIISHTNSEAEIEEIRKKKVVKSAIGTLSYSELEAILYIFGELKNDEGVLVASKIADKVGITRSVIVNALRKLESAGLIESRSLGMKGTFIKVLNDKLINEVNKIRN